ncbi:hypothetical protein ACFO4O_08720 [Glaciecola siphonariae]|uniref:SnoaL-like domain-containing protein n=1 Tax=Glaciecola siphonariae TaxID=521012 RepID=A0ABV9LUP2_9ALTE
MTMLALNIEKAPYEIALENSRSLHRFIKTKNFAKSAALYEPFAMLEGPAKELYLGQEDIQLFWEQFSAFNLSSFSDYKGQISHSKTDSISISARWPMNNDRYIMSFETWAVDSEHSCLLIEQRIVEVSCHSTNY